MSENKLKTIIVLEKSTYAHEFHGEEIVHREEFDRVIHLIENQLAQVKSHVGRANEGHLRFYNTVSIFGERGTGKTSFLYSVIEDLKSKHGEDIEIIGTIDPTIIEEKEHVFLLVVSLINDLVDRKLKGDECRANTEAFQQRKLWQKQLLSLAKGLPTLDKIGEDRKTSNWQSHDFIMEKGLDIVLSAFNLEKEFRKLVNQALDILGKKAFLLALDDIDVDMKKGWDVLEMLRKYITTPQIITILSGNLKLYSLNVRKHQWEQIKKNIKYERENDYQKTVNALEGQYLMKVLKAENRVHLHSIIEAMDMFDAQYEVVMSDGSRKDIFSVYSDILMRFGIRNIAQISVFARYLLSLSVRSQIQFVRSNESTDKYGIDSVEAFLSRLYAANVDVDIAVGNAQMLCLTIQKYLEKLESAPDLYLLMPNYPDDDMNACLTALTILFAREAKRQNFIIFDYLVRMGYVRNLLLELDQHYARKDFYNYVGLSQAMSLKNCTGLSIGFCMVYDTQLSVHISLLSLAGKNKQNKAWSHGHIDYEVEQKANHAQSIIAYLPISILQYTEKNESRLYYSFYNLLATIAEILKAPKDGMQRESVKALLKNLQLLRTYPAWRKEGDIQTKFVNEDEEVAFSEEIAEHKWEGDDTLNELAESIVAWSRDYSESVPPYLLGKISTRLYYTLQKIREQNLGEQMHRSVMAFLNACLVEELTENYVGSENMEGIEKLNISNVVTKDKIFLDNMLFVRRNNARESIKMTEWMIGCPLLWAFTNPDVMNIGLNIRLNVYGILQTVKVKDAVDKNKPEFSANKGKIWKTVGALKAYGYDIDSITNERIPVETVIEELDRSGIFRNKPQKQQITAFRRNYDPKVLEFESLTPEEYEEIFGPREEVPIAPAKKDE